MQLTALQKFIEYLEGIQERDNIPSWVVTTAKNCLGIEKQQIRRAFNIGGTEASEMGSEVYYNQTYRQNESTT